MDKTYDNCACEIQLTYYFKWKPQIVLRICNIERFLFVFYTYRARATAGSVL